MSDQTVTPLRVVTSNIEHGHPDAVIRGDLDWIIENFKPDIWGVQESEHYLEVLRGLKDKDYHLVLPKGAGPAYKDSVQLYNAKTMRFIGARGIFVADGGKFFARVINLAHYRHRDTGVDVFHANTHLFPGISSGGAPEKSAWAEISKKHIRMLADAMKQAAAKDNSVAFFTGDFNIDEDMDDRVEAPGWMQSTFDEYGLQSIYDELKTPESFDTHGNRKIDIIGGVKADKRVSAKNVRRSPKMHSDHRYILGNYEITMKTSALPHDPTGDPGSPTNPNAEPDPKPTKQHFEKDKGSQIDHKDCCGGEYA